ncbi:hypothetical protein [Bacillus sp. B15-48]|uniref:hypothetical protein n=1 Tax=Bacillus sp. B15-48 TaxID=1548601 RepID=UPI00193FDD46|nr:hypothetical protein [Bacillus sp. B15-48]MBM4761371.1 hypothetical protein [Bacillus sp. B15-48]
MFEHTPRYVGQIIQKAKDDDRNARIAANVLNVSISHMSPQRHYHHNKSQNKR